MYEQAVASLEVDVTLLAAETAEDEARARAKVERMDRGVKSIEMDKFDSQEEVKGRWELMGKRERSRRTSFDLLLQSRPCSFSAFCEMSSYVSSVKITS